MSRLNRTKLVALTMLLGSLLVPQVDAVEGRGFTMELLVDGRPVCEMPARGTTYVEALAGKEYSIRLTNRTGGRVAVALAVDGLNSINARTTSARRAPKWVLAPHESVTIDGWQTDQRTARRFFFTTEKKSYGAWLGKTANLGMIEAVVFRERRPRPINRDRSLRRLFGGLGAGEGVPAPAAPGTSGKEPGGRQESAAKAAPRLSDELAATGIGRKSRNPVERVRFIAERRPMTSLKLRYEYRPQLVALGVLPQPLEERALARRESARGFGDFEFAPDPYAR